MSKQLGHYRVSLVHWDVWEIWLDASSEEEAEAEAKRLFDDGQEDQFRHRDCGYDESYVQLHEEGGDA